MFFLFFTHFLTKYYDSKLRYFGIEKARKWLKKSKEKKCILKIMYIKNKFSHIFFVCFFKKKNSFDNWMFFFFCFSLFFLFFFFRFQILWILQFIVYSLEKSAESCRGEKKNLTKLQRRTNNNTKKTWDFKIHLLKNDCLKIKKMHIYKRPLKSLLLILVFSCFWKMFLKKYFMVF